MGLCALYCAVLFFKIKRELIPETPAMIRFFGSGLFLSRYLTDSGKKYRTRFWLTILILFIILIITLNIHGLTP